MPTPTETIHRFLHDGIAPLDWTVLETLYTEDVEVHMPFAGITLHGRDALKEHFAGNATLPIRLTPRNIHIHHTTDPDTHIAEFDYDITNTTTGDHTHVANIQVFTIRDGRIHATRDYHDHPGITRALQSGSADNHG